MKIIDLLNKIANGEEVPNKIKINNEIWIYDKNIDYKAIDERGYLFEVYSRINQEDLNEEVEIIEEDKKIKKLKPELLKLRDEEEHWEYVDYLRTNVQFLAEKVNEIIDKTNKDKNEKD